MMPPGWFRPSQQLRNYRLLGLIFVRNHRWSLRVWVFFLCTFPILSLLVVGLICHSYQARRRNALPRWYTICEDPHQWPGSFGEETGSQSGILDEMGTGTPLLYAHLRMDTRESGGWWKHLDWLYRLTTLLWIERQASWTRTNNIHFLPPWLHSFHFSTLVHLSAHPSSLYPLLITIIFPIRSLENRFTYFLWEALHYLLVPEPRPMILLFYIQLWYYLSQSEQLYSKALPAARSSGLLFYNI